LCQYEKLKNVDRGNIRGKRENKGEQMKLLEKVDKIKVEAPKIKDKASLWVKAHRSALIILTVIWVTILLIHFFGWWEALGILFIKFGLGLQVAGAKTFARAVAKVGGKKVLATATASMLAKRHLIDVTTKFFTEHSISKFSDNAKRVFKLKWEEFKSTSFVKKLQAFGLLLLSIPGVYFFWTKFISVTIQKLVYALIVPIFTLIWNLISGMFNILGFILEVLALNVLLEAIQNYEWGKKLVSWIDKLISFLADLFKYINLAIKKIFGIFGIEFEPKKYLITKSLQFNAWLVRILDKGLNKISKIKNKRDRYVNAFEKISEKRALRKQIKKDKKLSFLKTVKKSYRERFSKNLTALEKIEKRKLKKEERKQIQKQRIEKTIAGRRKKAIEKRKIKRESLILPYQELVRYGEVPFRAK
jgi:hypothetical protein